jgi:two-component system LytT family sensor kinase
MKTLHYLSCLLLLSFGASAQKKSIFWTKYGKVDQFGVNTSTAKIPLFIAPDTNTKSISPYNYLPADPLGNMVYLSGATTAKLTTRVHKDSLGDYRYSVIENDTVVKAFDAKLNKVDFVWNEYSDFPGYLTMDLGISAIKGKKITVRIYRLPKVNEVSTLIIYNKPLPVPRLIEALLVAKTQKQGFPAITKLNDGKQIALTDTTLGIAIKKRKTDIDFVQNLLLKYEKDGKSYSMKLADTWAYNSNDGNPAMFIDVVNFRNPGNYEILAQTKLFDGFPFKQSKPVSLLKFTVVSPIVFSLKELILIALAIVAFALVIIFTIRRMNRNKLAKVELQKELVKSDLNTVRAQLNPHFVFNALSGIQSLMNNNAVEQANNYLGQFANLTRQILDERELISIEDEIKLLQDYLTMEQLRFPFTVEFLVQEEESFNYIEIPTMLLQPFVENAVKYGIADLKGAGKITVKIAKEQQNIVLMVKDNGKGFDRSVATKGLGLKLSEKRIALLNENYKTCPIELAIDTAAGTTVQITLTNWLT